MIKQALLRRELRKGGAHGDARDLAALTAYMSAGIPSLSRRTKREIAEQLGLQRPHRSWVRGMEFGSAFAACLVLVLLFSQMAIPGSPLYAIKRVSEDARLKVQPSFMYEIVDRRKAELTDLEQRKANVQTIKQAQADLQISVDAAEKMERESGITQPNLSNLDLNGSTSTTQSTSGGGSSNGSGSTPGGSGSTSGGSGSSPSGSTSGGSGSTTNVQTDIKTNDDTKPDDH